MRKLLFSIIVSSVVRGASVGFAQQVALQLSTSSVDVNSSFGVTIRIYAVAWWWDIQVDGLEKFQVVGQSTSTSVQTVQGVSTSETILLLQLDPSETGTFRIGPARIVTPSGEILSNSEEITVVGEQLFGGGWASAPSAWSPEIGQKNMRDIVYHRFAMLKRYLAALVVVVWTIIRTRTKHAVSSGETIAVSRISPSSEKSISLPSVDDPWFLRECDRFIRDRMATISGYEKTMIEAMTYEELLLCLEHRLQENENNRALTEPLKMMSALLYSGASYRADDVLQTLVEWNSLLENAL